MLLASPVVLPTACGVLVVALLALRRGRQPWLEAVGWTVGPELCAVCSLAIWAEY